VRDITIENNSIEKRAQQPEFVNMGDPEKVSAGILVSAVISFSDNLKASGSSGAYELTSGNSVTGVSVGTNNISAAFKPAVVNVLSSGTVDSSWTSEKKGDRYYADKTFGACTAYQEVSKDEIVDPSGGGSDDDPSDGGSGTDPSDGGSGTEVDTRAENTLSVAGKTASVRYSKLKESQTLTVSKVIRFRKKGQGTRKYSLLSAKKGSKSYKTKFRINAKSGKVTVKKGLKKGTYKVRVRVTASGNDSHKPVSKTVTFKVKVK
jgi:methionine-rich copper-binding protein CopC